MYTFVTNNQQAETPTQSQLKPGKLDISERERERERERLFSFVTVSFACVFKIV